MQSFNILRTLGDPNVMDELVRGLNEVIGSLGDSTIRPVRQSDVLFLQQRTLIGHPHRRTNDHRLFDCTIGLVRVVMYRQTIPSLRVVLFAALRLEGNEGWQMLALTSNEIGDLSSSQSTDVRLLCPRVGICYGIVGAVPDIARVRIDLPDGTFEEEAAEDGSTLIFVPFAGPAATNGDAILRLIDETGRSRVVEHIDIREQRPS